MASDTVVSAGGVRPRLVVIEGGGLARRRRRVALAVAAFVAVAMFLLGAAVGAQASAPPGSEIAGTATVAPGGTLWDVAVAHAPPGTDPRVYLAELQRLNQLGGEVDPWTVVLLPVDDG